MAEKKDLSVSVSKEMMDVWESLDSIVAAVHEALADGWQIGSDLPAVVLTAAASLPKAVDGAEKIPQELLEDAPEFVMANAVGAAKIGGRFLKKKD